MPATILFEALLSPTKIINSNILIPGGSISTWTEFRFQSPIRQLTHKKLPLNYQTCIN